MHGERLVSRPGARRSPAAARGARTWVTLSRSDARDTPVGPIGAVEPVGTCGVGCVRCVGGAAEWKGAAWFRGHREGCWASGRASWCVLDIP